MRKYNLLARLLLFLILTGSALSSSAQIQPQFLGRFSTGIYNNTAAEISAYDPGTKRMFVLNGADTSFKVVNISNPASPQLITSISVKPYGIDLTSVAIKNGIVAVAVIDSLLVEPGTHELQILHELAEDQNLAISVENRVGTCRGGPEAVAL